MRKEKEPSSILIVDDEPMVLEFLQVVLGNAGYHVEGCLDAFEALNRLANESYDLVITDQKMPLMEGDQFARMVKVANPHLPILLLSANADSGDPTEMRCFDRVLEKPIGVAHLRDCVKAVLASSRALV